jgi:hypothetical protein
VADDWLAAQNSEDALTAQAAADTLWGRVQQWRALQFSVIVAVPVLLAVIAQWRAEFAPTAALFGFAMTMLDTIAVTPFLVARRKEAAQAQDRFDAVALGLPRSPLRRANDLEESTLRDLAAAQSRARASRNRDWYSAILGRLPQAIGRIACMRESAVWDAHLRRRWSNVIAVIALAAVAGFVAWSVYGGQSAADVLLRVLFPLTPALNFSAREWREQRDAARNNESLRTSMRAVWDDAVLRLDNVQNDLLALALHFSTELYRYRSSTFPVPHFLYKLLLGKQTLSTQQAAEYAVREYEAEVGT